MDKNNQAHLHDCFVDDANGVILNGYTNGLAIDEEGRVNVWVLADTDSGFGIHVGSIELRQLKKDEQGYYVA